MVIYSLLQSEELTLKPRIARHRVNIKATAQILNN